MHCSKSTDDIDVFEHLVQQCSGSESHPKVLKLKSRYNLFILHSVLISEYLLEYAAAPRSWGVVATPHGGK